MQVPTIQLNREDNNINYIYLPFIIASVVGKHMQPAHSIPTYLFHLGVIFVAKV